MMTIILTGTHLTPAVATIQALRRKAPEARLVYVGRKHTGAAESVERQEVERTGAEFAALTFGKLHRHFTWRQILELIKFPVGFWQAGRLIAKFKPAAVVSFGGYVALPLVIWGKLMGAKLIIHEQTTEWGLANRLVRWMADMTAVSWKTMVEPGVVWTGNPIREEIASLGDYFKDSPWRTPRRVLSGAPVLYITGGNQGSKTIDKVIEKILPDLVEKFEVFHQTKSVFNFKHPRYHSSLWFPTAIHADILSRAAISVSRAGANTVTELMYLGIPSILVPLPGSAGGEQEKNAEMMAETGLGKIIEQKDLTAERLLRAIGELARGSGPRPEERPVGGLDVPADFSSEKSGPVRKGNTAADKLSEIILKLIDGRR